MTDRYIKPGRSTHAFNAVVKWLTLRGVSILGSRELAVQGRTSGEWRTTPVNLLTVDDQQYLVAPRGITEWVRNIRISGVGRLRVGRRVTDFRAEELPDDAKPVILRAYLRRWKWEIGQFFDGVGPDATDDQLRQIAPGYPVFLVVTG